MIFLEDERQIETPELGRFWPRETALAKRIQGGLQRLYAIDSPICISHYISVEPGRRESLFLKESNGELLVQLVLPKLSSESTMDELCQMIEGVSHFVYIAERTRRDLQTTKLELELQAEIDKYVILAASYAFRHDFSRTQSQSLRRDLYERVHFLHEASSFSPLEERYRLANRLAAKYTKYLETHYISLKKYNEMRRDLRHFYHLGQEGKLQYAYI